MGREAHELQKLRVAGRVSRAGTCDTEEAWKPACALLCTKCAVVGNTDIHLFLLNLIPQGALI